VSDRVLDSVERIARVARTSDGEVPATALLERFGFTGDRLTTRIGDLSGGERRRLQLLRLLLSEPNVLLLDEPTNDLDIDTLTVLEDFLDGWPGTLVVVSHDRYFLERVCDSVWALLGDGQVSMLPRGVEEYLERRADALADSSPSAPGPAAVRTSAAAPFASSSAPGHSQPAPTAPGLSAAGSSAAEQRDARKTINRIDRQLTKLTNREAELHAKLAEHASDYERLAELGEQLRELTAEKDALEEEWLTAAAVLDD